MNGHSVVKCAKSVAGGPRLFGWLALQAQERETGRGATFTLWLPLA